MKFVSRRGAAALSVTCKLITAGSCSHPSGPAQRLVEALFLAAPHPRNVYAQSHRRLSGYSRRSLQGLGCQCHTLAVSPGPHCLALSVKARHERDNDDLTTTVALRHTRRHEIREKALKSTRVGCKFFGDSYCDAVNGSVDVLTDSWHTPTRYDLMAV